MSGICTIFLAGETNATGVVVKWSEVDVKPGRKVTAVRNLWAGKSVPFFGDRVVVDSVIRHDTVLLRIETVEL